MTQPPLDRAPSEAAMAAAYQVTARYFTSEQQLIWRRTALFIALNALVIGALNIARQLPPAIQMGLPAAGFLYSLCWHFSMTRAWSYHDFLVRMMREHEDALQLSRHGTFTRARAIAQGVPDTVGGEPTKFSFGAVVFKARFLANATTWLFVAGYLYFLVRGIQNLRVIW